MNAPNCAGCKHSQAYHDGDGGHVCRAWDPDQIDFFCACKGWTEPKKSLDANAAPGLESSREPGT